MRNGKTVFYFLTEVVQEASHKLPTAALEDIKVAGGRIFEEAITTEP
jgi:hypothetical protein